MLSPLLGVKDAGFLLLRLSILIRESRSLPQELHLWLVKLFEHLSVFLHIEDFASPFGNDDGCLLLSDCHLALEVFGDIFVLLLPLALHLRVQRLAQLEVHLVLVEDSFQQSFEDVDVMNLAHAISIDFYFQVFQQFQRVHFFHYDLLFVIDKVSVLLPQSCVLLGIRAVVSIVKLNPDLPLAKRWWQLIQQKDQIVDGDPACSLRVVVPPELEESFDLVTSYNPHVFLLGSVQTFNDCRH